MDPTLRDLMSVGEASKECPHFGALLCRLANRLGAARFTSNLVFLTLVLASMSSISLPYYVKWTGHANDPKRAVPFGGRHSAL
jgi:hypothetical protein